MLVKGCWARQNRDYLSPGVEISADRVLLVFPELVSSSPEVWLVDVEPVDRLNQIVS